jgi:hypothetical protein
MRRSATAASGGSPPASWRAWRRSTCRPTATASATATACSARRSRRLAGRAARDLAGARQPLGVRAPRERLRDRLRRLGRRRGERRRRRRLCLAPAERVIATAYDTPIVGWRGAGEHAAPVEGGADRPDPARRLQRRRPHRRAGGEQPGRRADARALSGRRTPGGPGAAAAAGVLLLLGLAAGHRAPAPAAVRHARTSPTRWRSSSTTRIRRSASPS